MYHYQRYLWFVFSNPFSNVIAGFYSPTEDLQGYARSDLMPLSDTNIDATTGEPTAPRMVAGMLRLKGSTVGQCLDGTSNTIAFMEDAGKMPDGMPGGMVSGYLDNNPYGVDKDPGGRRSVYRWAEPNITNGVSGPPSGSEYGKKALNNSYRPVGGPPDCPWTTRNCGPNDEAFSFHPGVVIVVFGDGHVDKLRDTLSPIIVRALITPMGSEAINFE